VGEADGVGGGGGGGGGEVVVVVEAGGSAGGGTVVEVVVVVVGRAAGAAVVVVLACGRFDARWNALAIDVDVRDRLPAAWRKLAIWTAMTAQTVTSKIGTSPMARPRRAKGEDMGESSWVGNVWALNHYPVRSRRIVELRVRGKY
jgi:hypothetical protein